MRALACLILLLPAIALAGPETSLREFGSSQVKKGVRSIGMGGNGATFGNYSLVYRDAYDVIADYGVTHFSDTKNDIHFVAVGATSPRFWNNSAAFYLIVLGEWGSGLKLHLKTPQYAKGTDVLADGDDEVAMVRFAKKLPKGFNIGVQLGWERAALRAVSNDDGGVIRYDTTYLPSGGLGISWSIPRLLIGVRTLLTNDWETRNDALGDTSGWVRSWEFRAGVAVRPFAGTVIDAGWVGILRSSAVENTGSFVNAFVLGIEQAIYKNNLFIRAGWNESSPTAGITVAVGRVKLDVAYVHNLGVERTNGLFGKVNDAVMATLNVYYSPSSRASMR